MFTEILKIIPKLDAAALNKMQRDLSSRFTKVAKGFGKGLMQAFKGGAIAGAAISLIDKLLNPLKETQEAIDRTLSKADDIVTNAEQFGTTPGQLFKLQKFAQAKGLESDALNQLLVKFQGAIAEANADPKKDTSVRAFAGEKDIAKAFFEFIQSLNKMDRNQQVLVQQEVFGEKQTLKMAEFLRADFGQLEKNLKLKPAAAYDKPLTKLDNLEDRQSELTAARDAQDILQKSRLITGGMIDERAKAEQLELARENERIANFKNIQSINETGTKIATLVEQGVFMLGDLINKVTPAINNVVNKLDTISKSGLIRGIFGGKGK